MKMKNDAVEITSSVLNDKKVLDIINLYRKELGLPKGGFNNHHDYKTWRDGLRVTEEIHTNFWKKLNEYEQAIVRIFGSLNLNSGIVRCALLFNRQAEIKPYQDN
ncbi:MAG: hypothetical protein Q7R89_01995, partial [bacterium]|nr:hypothetical protein [bacterium]